MAVNTSPIFIKEGGNAGCLITSANTAFDGSGTLGTDIFELLTATTDGTRVEGVRFIPSQATVGIIAAKVFRIYITDTGGTNPLPLGEVAMAQSTRSNTAAGTIVDYFFPQPIILKSGQKILVSQSVRATSADNTACYPIGFGNF